MSVDPKSNDTKSKNISVVPWYNTAQFKKVYEYLFSTELVKKRWAVDQISVWETRCHPSLPTAIEASVVIVRAIIQDILLTNGASLCQERDIQMMYSMALVRFVNLTIEAHKNSDLSLVTTAQIAKGLGIPSWIVDLRNEATHSFSPSLASLRMAADAALKFLNESFWEKEISTLKNLERELLDETNIRGLIYSYITLYFNILKNEDKKDSKQLKQDYEESKIVILKIVACIQKNKRQFINILISDGLFIPYDDELKNVMSPSECLQYEEAFDEAYDIQSRAIAGLSIPPVPVELQNLWRRMLDVLNRLHAMPLLLEALLKSQAERSEMGKKLVIAWAITILDCEGNLKKLFRTRGLTVNWHSLFNAAVSQPCVYTPYIFCRLYTHLNLKKSAVRYILYLLSIAIGHSSWNTVQIPKNYPVYTVDDLKQMKKLQNAKRDKPKEESIWSVVEDSSYKSWPIGFVSHPVDDFDKADDQPDDYIPLEYFEEKMDFTEKYFIINKNDNEEEDFEVNQPSISEDEMEISERPTFLYKMK